MLFESSNLNFSFRLSIGNRLINYFTLFLIIITTQYGIFANAEPRTDDFDIPQSLLENYQIEPSGALYLPDFDQFLIISDETEKMPRAVLFLVNQKGDINPSPLAIKGLQKISDVESISQEGKNIYLLSSQSLTKKSNEKSKRNLFVQLERQGLELKLQNIIELRPLLLEALENSDDKKLRHLATDAYDSDLEIESHFVEDNSLYIGLKRPFLRNGDTAILKISKLNNLFEKRELKSKNIELWNSIDFSEDSDYTHRLSELIHVGSYLLAATSCKDDPCGAVWKINLKDNKPAKQIKFFEELKPEGLAFDVMRSTLFITFDQKNDTPEFYKIKFKRETKN